MNGFQKKNYYVALKETGYINYVCNLLSGEEYEVSDVVYTFLMELDGTKDPFLLGQKMGMTEVEIADLLNEFNCYGFLETKKKMIKLDGILWVPLWILKQSRELFIWKCLACLMLFCWLPLLVFGLNVLLSSSWGFIELNISIVSGFFGGLAVGFLMHEYSRAVVCLATGGEVKAYGACVHLSSFFCIPHILLDTTKVKSRANKIMIGLAGCMGNFFTAGLLLLLLLRTDIFDSIGLIIAAGINFAMAIYDLSPFSGDLIDIMDDLFDDDALETAKYVVFNREVKQRLKESFGKRGKLLIFICYMIFLWQYTYPVIWGIFLLLVYSYFM